MLTTKNYNFKKPELTDSPPDITVLNDNFDTIDEKLFAIIKAWEDFKTNGGEIGGTIIYPNGTIGTNFLEQQTVVNGRNSNVKIGTTNINGYPAIALAVDDIDNSENSNALVYLFGSGKNEESRKDNYFRPLKKGNSKDNLGSPSYPWDILYLREKVTVKKDDGYVEVEDSAGRRIAMHLNGGIGWIHLFNKNGVVVSDLTFGENGDITSKGTVLNNVPCCKVYHKNNIAYPAINTKNTLPWDNILFQSEPGMCGNVGTTANLVAKKSGIYQIDCFLDVVNANGQIQADLSKNNTDFICTARAIPTADGTTTLHLSGMYQLNEGDYVQIHFYNQGSRSCTLSNNRRFQMHMVRGDI